MEADKQSVKDNTYLGGNRSCSGNGKSCLVLDLYYTLVFCFA